MGKSKLFERSRLELGLGNDWFAVKDYPGYWITPAGEVLSAHRRIMRVLKWQTKQTGHKYTTLVNRTGSKALYQHRLVAMQFIDNPRNLPCINHKDNDPANNRVENLEWCDWAYNNAYAAKQGRMGKKLGLSDVETIKRLSFVLSSRELAHLFSVHKDSIIGIKSGKFWKYHPGLGKTDYNPAKLVSSQVDYIRHLLAAGYATNKIAAWYDVSSQAIHLIKKRKNWAGLPDPAPLHQQRARQYMAKREGE